MKNYTTISYIAKKHKFCSGTTALVKRAKKFGLHPEQLGTESNSPWALPDDEIAVFVDRIKPNRALKKIQSLPSTENIGGIYVFRAPQYEEDPNRFWYKIGTSTNFKERFSSHSGLILNLKPQTWPLFGLHYETVVHDIARRLCTKCTKELFQLTDGGFSMLCKSLDQLVDMLKMIELDSTNPK